MSDDMRHAAGEPDPKLLELLVCPVTKGPLTYDRAAQELISPKANLAFPIRNGVPLMTVEAARSLGDSSSTPGGD
ncbi:Trm112 family protein [Hyphomicrobium sp.]|uniref:Trm112 family protein n=1 Tax=Hyphomicrobium sp. TaxID=82 RepID=UPI002FDDA051